MTDSWGDIDGPSLLAVASSLQLRLTNVHALVRLQRLAAFAARLPPRPAARKLSSSTIKRLLNLDEVGGPDIRQQEDAFEGIYVVEIPFYGGPRLVLQGQATECGRVAAMILTAIFGTPVGTFPKGYLLRAKVLAKFVLELSDSICRSAGLQVGDVPSDNDRIEVPSASSMSNQASGVQMTERDVFAEYPAHLVEFLSEKLIQNQGEIPPWTEGELLDDQIILKPLVRSGGLITIASPGELTAYLRHQLVLEAYEWKCHEALALAVRELTAARAVELLRGITDEPFEDIEVADSALIRLTAPYDTDKTLDVIVFSDDLQDYNPDSPYGSWNAWPLADQAASVFNDGRSSPDKTLRLIIYQGIGRDMGFAIPNSREPAPTLFLPLGDLETILQTPGTDDLTLWYFARASEKFQADTHVLSFSAVDLYSMYHDQRDSFYTSDDARPNAVFVQVARGQDLRVENFRKIGRRDLVHPTSQTLVEAHAMHGISSPVHMASGSSGVSFFVSLRPIPAWVHLERSAQGKSRGFLFEIGEAVAFWIWQIHLLAPEVLGHLPESPLQVTVIEDILEEGPSAEGEWIRPLTDSSGRRTLRIQQWPTPKPNDPSNEIDRDIVSALLQVLEVGTPTRSAADRDALIDRLAPPGFKKMIHLFGSDDDPLKWPGELTPARRTQDAVFARVLDELGEHLTETLGLNVGPIAPEERTKFLNNTVSVWLIDQLNSVIADLEQKGLLLGLLEQYEALISETTRERDHLQARIACFGAEDDQALKMAKHASKATASSLASRFLIEYVSAAPSTGHQPLTRERYDHLLALASEIVDTGMLSDAIQHGLTDIELSVLPSGRFGTNHDEDNYYRALAGFGQARAEKAFAEASAHGLTEDEVESAAIPIAEIDACAVLEFGFSYTDFAAACGQILGLANEQNQGDVLTFAHGEIEQRLRTELGWSAEKVLAFIAGSTLGPIGSGPDHFWQRRADVYPWRFNRERSYLRRPLICHETDGIAVVSGRRNLWQAPGYRLNQFRTGRLQAKTRGLNAALGRQRKRNGELFEVDVASRLKQLGFTNVRRRLRRVGQYDFRNVDGEDIGDIDVIAVDQLYKVIVVVEAKDLEVARTPAELANEVENLVYKALPRLGKRTAWVQGHLQPVLAELGIANATGHWEVRSVVVVDEGLISERLLKNEVPIVAINKIETVLTASRDPSSQRRKRQEFGSGG
ncbi:hypothetical protein [Lacisediminihabitans sp. H27-G8]|uniref:hypothetical protein n=1 Tax=Lacisediminihabitans sp. H27-G8 TaxID=3111909 RepID=UPI0038FC30C5